jgi:hypothetical protein
MNFAWAADSNTPIQQESIIQWLSTIASGIEAQMFLVLVVVGIIGQMAGYTWKWLNSQIQGNLFQYLFRDNGKLTAITYISYLVAMLTAISTNVFTPNGTGFAGWSNVVVFGLNAAFALDLAANRGKTLVWSKAKRTKVRKELKAKAEGIKEQAEKTAAQLTKRS